MVKERFEIGSEYFLDVADISTLEDNFHNRFHGFRTTYYNTGRSAIKGVLRQLKGKKALLPAYICQSVIQAFEQENYSINFYNISKDLSIDINDLKRKLSSEIDIFFLMHYYGVLQNQSDLITIRNLCKIYSITIIEDTTHSILTKMHTIGDYCIASLRKWFALPDGGVTYSLLKKIDEIPLNNEMPFANNRAAGMFLKGLFLKGVADYNELYRKLFAEAEKMIDEEAEISAISEFSNVILNFFDVGKAIQKRKENADYLHRHINNTYVKHVFVEFNKNICPFFYPLYVKNRDEFRNYLNQNKVYCPVHWPVTDKRLLDNNETMYISDHIISIPIDQRYSVSDMECLCKIINKYRG